MTDEKYTILCVDDDKDFVESVKMVLDANGYNVETAASAEEGLKKFKAKKPDFMLVDLMMEEVDAGVGLVKEIKLLGNTAPIFLLSSVGEQLNISVDHHELGLSGVFQKPVNFDNLLTTIAEKLSKAK